MGGSHQNRHDPPCFGEAIRLFLKHSDPGFWPAQTKALEGNLRGKPASGHVDPGGRDRRVFVARAGLVKKGVTPLRYLQFFVRPLQRFTR